MLKSRLFCAAALCAAAAFAQAAPAGKASVEKLFELQQFDRNMDEAVRTMPAAATASMQQFLPENITPAKKQQINKILNRHLTEFAQQIGRPQIRNEIRHIATEGVRKIYTQEEVDALIAFYSSPIGRSINAKMPQFHEATQTPLLIMMQAELQKFSQHKLPQIKREINQVLCGKNTCPDSGKAK